MLHWGSIVWNLILNRDRYPAYISSVFRHSFSKGCFTLIKWIKRLWICCFKKIDFMDLSTLFTHNSGRTTDRKYKPILYSYLHSLFLTGWWRSIQIKTFLVDHHEGATRPNQTFWSSLILPTTRELNVFRGICQSFCSQSASWLLSHCSSLLKRGRYASYWNAFLF